MKNILLPTDFSENSWNAIKYALAFFKDTPCDFYLLHVTLISNYTSGEFTIYPTTEVLDKTLLKKAKTDLKKFLDKVKKHPLSATHKFFDINSYNYFVDAIREQIKENFIDLIVMGTKGASGLNEIILGSNTGDLITQVKCPVLVVPEKAVFSTPKEIAFPTDYNIFYPTAILNSIAEIAKMFRSAIRILHVVRKDEELTSFQQDNKNYLHDFFINRKHSFHRITNKKIENGIQCFVESRNINMIVMVAKNINLFQRILFRPTVEEISYHIEIPFLVVHEQNN
ncbi:universal stress protein [Lutibacter sp. HS1-25]|uniref:universal stress protein n=1 Tax=Lutibacter sp. HS1-25 TaxID=2485000 RepID=UPI0010131DBA|nr:universal stress protein [Lutibacter sp. HS1-25]RXP63589.1 universal stress protein [Lutibacter sp. HS1-25]